MLKLEQREDGWWIIGFPEGYVDHGPYETKKDANESRVSIEHTLRHMDERGFITSEKKRKSCET